MRTLFALAAVVAITPAAFAHKDRIAAPRTLAIGFGTGETATFSLKGSEVTGLSLRVGPTDRAVPQAECAKLREIRFDTASLGWDGTFESAEQADYCFLDFDMGAESTRSFGALPRVRLMFRDGKFAGATVRKMLSRNSWQDSPL